MGFCSGVCSPHMHVMFFHLEHVHSTSKYSDNIQTTSFILSHCPSHTLHSTLYLQLELSGVQAWEKSQKSEPLIVSCVTAFCPVSNAGTQ